MYYICLIGRSQKIKVFAENPDEAIKIVEEKYKCEVIDVCRGSYEMIRDVATKGATMRKPEYLSPTAIQMWIKDQKEYYLNYLTENRPPRMPQTDAMSVGSAFDAFVKAHLHEVLFGTPGDYALEDLFEKQVEPQHRDFAWGAGKRCFERYQELGSLADLMIHLEKASGEPRFEIEVRGDVNGVTLLGKPDLYFVNESGCNVILDWKVNGYCSKWGASPKKGYLKLRPDGTIHKEAMPGAFCGMSVNYAHPLDLIDEQWALQLSVYSWLLGVEVGSKFVVAIDQLCWKNDNMRVAAHRALVGQKFQMSRWEIIQDLWNRIQEGWIFKDMTLEESQARCEMLDGVSEGRASFEGLW